MSILRRLDAADVLLLYPGDSLQDQIGFWSQRHLEWRLDMSFERSLPKIRTLLRRADVALVDATQDPATATEAFLQAVARLGTAAVAMYTESMHDDLEVFVRVHGSMFLLGPLADRQWEELFERVSRTRKTLPGGRVPPRRRVPPSAVRERFQNRREQLVRRFYAGIDWPAADMD